MARILIVEDAESDRTLLGAILEAEGHEVFFAEDGEEALSEYGGQAIDVVITDLQMPNVHGLELITLLMDSTPRPAIIAISGTGADQLAMAQALGAMVTVRKPVIRSELLSAVAMAVSEMD